MERPLGKAHHPPTTPKHGSVSAERLARLERRKEAHLSAAYPDARAQSGAMPVQARDSRSPRDST